MPGTPIPLTADFNLLSESIRKFPEVTIFSPAFNPLSTMTRLSTLSPSVTLRGSKYPAFPRYKDKLFGT